MNVPYIMVQYKIQKFCMVSQNL